MSRWEVESLPLLEFAEQVVSAGSLGGPTHFPPTAAQSGITKTNHLRKVKVLLYRRELL